MFHHLWWPPRGTAGLAKVSWRSAETMTAFFPCLSVSRWSINFA
jgi:hypothetical protein